MIGGDPMGKMVEAPRSEFPRGLGTYVYRVLQGSSYSPYGTINFDQGLNELSVPISDE
jgi:hypothetical protein